MLIGANIKNVSNWLSLSWDCCVQWHQTVSDVCFIFPLIQTTEASFYKEPIESLLSTCLLINYLWSLYHFSFDTTQPLHLLYHKVIEQRSKSPNICVILEKVYHLSTCQLQNTYSHLKSFWSGRFLMNTVHCGKNWSPVCFQVHLLERADL